MTLKIFLLLLANTLPYSSAFQSGPLHVTAGSHSTKLFYKQSNNNNEEDTIASTTTNTLNRRQFAVSIPASIASLVSFPVSPSFASDEVIAGTELLPPVEVTPNGDIKKLFNEARAMEGQGNIPAAQRIYSKITKVAPRVSKASHLHEESND